MLASLQIARAIHKHKAEAAATRRARPRREGPCSLPRTAIFLARSAPGWYLANFITAVQAAELILAQRARDHCSSPN